MTDTLRTRIAAAIYNACDDYTRKLLVRPDCPGASELEGDGKPVCYTLADAVIAALRVCPGCDSGEEACGQLRPERKCCPDCNHSGRRYV